MGDLLKHQQLGALREIASKLGTLTKIDENTKGLLDIKDTLKDISDMVKEFGSMRTEFTQMKEDVTTIKNELYKLNNFTAENTSGATDDAEEHNQTLSVQVKSFIDYMKEDREKNRIASEAYRIRKAYKRSWSNIANKRKMAFYGALRASSIAAVYETFLGKDDIFIPRKFKQNPNHNESETERRRRNSLSIKKMENEIEHLKELALKKENIKDNCEAEIKKIVSKSNECEVRQKLMEIWFEEIRMEENTSLAIWEPKLRWFEEMERREKDNERTSEDDHNRDHEASETATAHTDVTHPGGETRSYSDALQTKRNNRNSNTHANTNRSGNRMNGVNNTRPRNHQGSQPGRNHGQSGRPGNNTQNNNQAGRAMNGGNTGYRRAPQQNNGWGRSNGPNRNQDRQGQSRNNAPQNRRQQHDGFPRREDNYQMDNYDDTYDDDATYADQQQRGYHPRDNRRPNGRHYQRGDQSRESFLDENRTRNRRY